MPAWVRRLFATTPRIASLDDLFGIDVRALGVIRVLVATIVLFELAIRAPFLRAFYGDLGILPVDAALSYWDAHWWWSVHLFGGVGMPFTAGVFVVQALVAGALLAGYRTRIASILTWFFYASLINANALIVSGDGFLCTLLFIGMFLPWGSAYSLDALRARGNSPSRRALSAWTAAFLLQLGFLYFFAVLYKEGAAWLSEGSAVYYVLSYDIVVTSFGAYLLKFPALLQFLTFAIVIFQHVAPFLLFFPFFLRSLRGVALLGLIFMHLSFVATLHLGSFSFIMLTALLAFVPSTVWDWLEQRLSLFSVRSARGRSEGKRISRALTKVGVYASGVLGVSYIVYMFFWQAAAVPRLQWPFPEDIVFVAKVLRIEQQWRLFSPYPPTNDGWMLGIGTQPDGGEVDVIQNRQPVSYEKPASMAAYFGNERWRKYFFNIVSFDHEPYYAYYADYLCRSWNAGQAEAESVEVVTLVYMSEETPSPGSSPPEAVRRELIAWDCQGEYAL